MEGDDDRRLDLRGQESSFKPSAAIPSISVSQFLA